MARYFLNVGANWSSTANWSDSDGGAGGFSVPTSTDDVFFTALSGNCTVDVTTRVAKTLIFTGYTNTITMTNPITSSGNVTLVAAMIIAGTGRLELSGTATLTSNGKTWPNDLFVYGGSFTYTLADNWTISGSFLTQSSGGTNVIFNGNQLRIAGSLSHSFATVNGTTLFVLNGTGTWTNSWLVSITLNTVGTITVSGTVGFGAGTLTYTAGTIITTGSNLSIASACTLNVNGIIWNNATFSNLATTVTFSSNFTCSGNFVQVNTITIAGSPTITVGGNLTFDAITGSGSAWIMNGTGTYTRTNPSGSTITFNTAGTITMSTAQTNGLANFTHTSGTVVTTNTTTAFAGTYSGASVTWNNANISGVQTMTLSTDINIGGTLTYGSLGQTTTINGAFNINISGGLSMAGTSSVTSGTATIRLVGTGSINSTQTTSGLQNNLIIDTTGTITLVGLRYSTGTLTYTTGTVIGGTLTIAGSCTLNTSGVTWNDIIALTGTITLSSTLLTITLTIAASGNITFAGAAGYTIGTFSCVTAGRTITHTISRTYTITNSLILTGTAGNRITMNSSSGGTKAVFNLQAGAIQNVINCNATDVDSSSGQTIYTVGTLSNTFNWNIRSGMFAFFMK